MGPNREIHVAFQAADSDAVFHGSFDGGFHGGVSDS